MRYTDTPNNKPTPSSMSKTPQRPALSRLGRDEYENQTPQRQPIFDDGSTKTPQRKPLAQDANTSENESFSSAERVMNRRNRRRRASKNQEAGGTIFLICNIERDPMLLLVKERFHFDSEKNHTWGPPGGGKKGADLNKFVAGEREFREETTFPWQAIANDYDTPIKCFTWHLLEDASLTDESGDRWVLLINEDAETVQNVMKLNLFADSRETIDIGWIRCMDVLKPNYDEYAVDGPQPMYSIYGATPPYVEEQGPLRPQYAADTQQVLRVVMQRIADKTMVHC